ncbi:LRR receptor-like serine threonine-protein kinase At4g08850-like [Seminavis robusta]|uniref:LRR receptor-like serine threonine-protein kinase At4g08850-like n=1 Tax=Seminavis robusta TaxID=568900 RepID=A0A9N8HPV0_9STRA|nr:LRR receptor-like serine threonine-protein kinase At4g08850-like [Seminavis robusta]|eukprot:Sro1213_g252970.1 LRR receptor-like serine threonine-protein kinase At4g08850-like (1028) ;mRNA; r:12399-15943
MSSEAPESSLDTIEETKASISSSMGEESGASQVDDFAVGGTGGGVLQRPLQATFQATMREEAALMPDSFQTHQEEEDVDLESSLNTKRAPSSESQDMDSRQLVEEREEEEHPQTDDVTTDISDKADSYIGEVDESEHDQDLPVPNTNKPGQSRRSQSAGSPVNTSSKMLQRQYQRRSGKDDIEFVAGGSSRSNSPVRPNAKTPLRSSAKSSSTATGDLGVRRGTLLSSESATKRGDGRLGNSSLRDLDSSSGGQGQRRRHSYHARKQPNDDSLSDSSDFFVEIQKKGTLGSHLVHPSTGKVKVKRESAISRRSSTDSIDSIDMTIMQDPAEELLNKIGDLKVKPVTEASLQAAKDKSASTRLFAKRKPPKIDQRVNLMDATAGNYETGSNSSTSGSGISGNSSGRGSKRLNAPSRPKKYPSRQRNASKADVGLVEMITGGGSSDSTSSKRYRSKRPATIPEKQTSFWCRWEVFAFLWFLLLVAVLCVLPLFVKQTGGGSEATKSGINNNLDRTSDPADLETKSYRDGTVFLPPHATEATANDRYFRDGTISLQQPHVHAATANSDLLLSPSTTSKMSEMTQQVAALEDQLSELKELIVQHGISKADSLDWSTFHDTDDNDFQAMTPQTKALLWLAHHDTLHTGTEARDVQHHKLFQRYSLAVLYYATHGLHRNGTMSLIPNTGHGHTDFFPTSFLYQKEHETSWINSHGWLSKESVCGWIGVVCANNSDEEEILAVNLTNNGLSGKLPLQELTTTLRWSLHAFDLSGNNIHGCLDFGMPWPRLQKIYMQNNFLSGTLPVVWLKGCKAMEEILLSGNYFEGSIPELAFEDSDSLRRIQLDHNKLSGRVPVLGHLLQLEYLEFQGNSFTGPFPIGVFMLSNLVTLRAGSNLLSGTLSTDLSNMIDLEVLEVENNRLEGTVPDVFYTLPNMTHLSLRGNGFSGPLPESLAAMEKLETLSLEENQFSGTLSPSLSALTNLKSLLLHHNRLSGKVPDEVCALKEGFFNLKKLGHVAADCEQKIQCACCDECY